MSEWLTTKEVAERKNITDSRVRQLILEKKLPAKKFGHLNMVNEKDLELIKDIKRGRPKKDK